MRQKKSAILLIVMGLTSTAWAMTVPRLAVSIHQFCFLVDTVPAINGAQAHEDKKEAACWNEKGEPIAIPIKLDHPTAIVTGSHLGVEGAAGTPNGDYTCALDAGSVRCWGTLGPRLNEIFRHMKRATLLSAGSSDLCVYDLDEGLLCEGGGGQAMWTKIAPEARRYRHERFIALDVGTYYACGVTRTLSAICWGGIQEAYESILQEPFRRERNEIDRMIRLTPRIPTSANAITISISVGLAQACLLLDDKGTCWGRDFRGETRLGLREVDSVVASAYRTCKLQKGAFQCAGEVEPTLEKFIRVARNTGTGIIAAMANKEEFTGDRETCVATDRNVRCFGHFETAIGVNLSSFDLASLEQEFSQMSSYAYREKAEILDQVAKLIIPLRVEKDEDARTGRFFALWMLRELVAMISSDYFKNNIVPRYESMVDYYKNAYNVKYLKELRGRPYASWLTLEMLEIVIDTIHKHALLKSEQGELNEFRVVLSEALGYQGPRNSQGDQGRLRWEIPPSEMVKVGEAGTTSLKAIHTRLFMMPRYKGIAKLMMTLLVFCKAYS